MVVLKKIFIFSFFLIFTISKTCFSSIILDHETELFIESLVNDIKDVNNINKNIKFVVIKNDNINAFVNQNNTIHITSGLIENCEDYVALLSVIAHEVGHVDMNHITQRIINYKKMENVSSLSNLSIIAGSLISNNPQILGSLSLSSAGSQNISINFNKNQEREADYYSIETLKKLNLFSESIINLLKEIEKNNKSKGLTKEMQKIGSHPYFEERIDIINYVNQKKNKSLDFDKNKKFNKIRSKFIGYGGNNQKIQKLNEKYKKYANSIVFAKNGDLKKSLNLLNNLILNNKNDIFLIETKADILFSYGYVDESLKFYNKVIEVLPNNYYVKIRIFENTNLKSLSQTESEKIFKENLEILYKFYNNINLISSYLRLANYKKKNEWIRFFNYWINKEKNLEKIKKNLNEFKKTNDKELLNLINIIYNDLS